MIKAIFLFLWTILFVIFALLIWVKIKRYYKVDLLILFNFLYLTGLFLLFPRIEEMIRNLKGYFV